MRIKSDGFQAVALVASRQDERPPRIRTRDLPVSSQELSVALRFGLVASAAGEIGTVAT